MDQKSSVWGLDRFRLPELGSRDRDSEQVADELKSSVVGEWRE